MVAAAGSATSILADEADSLLRDFLHLPENGGALLRNLAAELDTAAYILEPDPEPALQKRGRGAPHKAWGVLVSMLCDAIEPLGRRDPAEAIALFLVGTEIKAPDARDHERPFVNLDRLIRSIARALARAKTTAKRTAATPARAAK